MAEEAEIMDQFLFTNGTLLNEKNSQLIHLRPRLSVAMGGMPLTLTCSIPFRFVTI